MAELDNAVENNAGTESTDTSNRDEISRLKTALDKATKEAADYKKALRQKQSDEEAAAEEKRIADEARDRELQELRQRIEVAEISKAVMGLVGDDKQATDIADALYGAKDAKAVIAAMNKIWTEKEKLIRLDAEKIGKPGSGASDGPTYTKEQLDAMPYTQRVKFANENPDEYAKLMGRT